MSKKFKILKVNVTREDILFGEFWSSDNDPICRAIRRLGFALNPQVYYDYDPNNNLESAIFIEVTLENVEHKICLPKEIYLWDNQGELNERTIDDIWRETYPLLSFNINVPELKQAYISNLRIEATEENEPEHMSNLSET